MEASETGLMDVNDSRKRPLDSELDQSIAKKSNREQSEDVVLKQLIPGNLAGVILGKGGETITYLQSSSGTVIKMSKGNEFYPGTSDRILLITGHAENVRNAHRVSWEKIFSRNEANKASSSDEYKMKIVVPNVTVGMIIGRGGCYIKQIKDDTGAYIQISQKAPDTLLVERVVTIGGTSEQMMKAFDMVLKMIIEDPQSGSCPNISYSDFKGPIANANPTGSPFAAAAASQGMLGFEMNAAFPGGFMPPNSGFNMPFGGMPFPVPNTIEAVRTMLRGSGFSILASDEITAALGTLIKYGILNSSGFAYPGFNLGPGQCGVTLDGLMGVLAGGGRGGGMGASGDMVSSNKGSKSGLGFGNGFDQFSGGYNMYNNNSMGGQNFGGGASSASSDNGTSVSKEIQIGENIVGAVLGHGGRAIVEIQRMTSASIQISKKGIFAPGTRNRIATISGNPASVERAIILMNQCIHQEESKRVRQEQMMK